MYSFVVVVVGNEVSAYFCCNFLCGENFKFPPPHLFLPFLVLEDLREMIYMIPALKRDLSTIEPSVFHIYLPWLSSLKNYLITFVYMTD